MNRIGKFICEKRVSILIITLLLLIPSFIGMSLTKINYDILVYLPDDIDTVKGQNILTDDFGMGAFSVTVIDNMHPNDILKLEEKIKGVEGVNKVISSYDVIGTSIPLEMLPSEVSSKLKNESSDMIFITYDDSTSSERTLNAIREVKKVTKDRCLIGGMSSMVLDTMDLSETEIITYIVIAVLLCIVVLELSLNSYIVPILLLLNIGIAILFNMGSNIIFGNISYITKALASVLQLGVTTDFSIFLYHSYENKKKKYKNNNEAMTYAISETFISVVGSSLTTIAGFLVLCSMNLTIGKDLGLVMAKGVLLGVICTLTIFPVLLLTFDRLIQKTKHRGILPEFNRLSNFVIKYHKVIFVLFVLIIVPAYLANSKVDVYYKLDDSLPNTLDSIRANEKLKEKFNIVSPEIILANSNMKYNDIDNMISEIEELSGIDFVLSPSEINSFGLDKFVIPENTLKSFENDKYQMIFVNSSYDIATDELNNQIESIQKIINKYDENALLAGEGPLMRDLVRISDNDFKNVNYFSVGCILVIMLFVLMSVSLPFLLIATIETAIFINMSIPYFNGTVLPFVAPIVLGTIQLGATIDYAILMTTTYLNHRNNGIEKEEAIRNTLSTTVSSIAVSALCFFGATFGVGIYSELEMISSLCTLISRGAIISMFTVILVLPSILLIFDKLIMKSTLRFKKGDVKMKNSFKKVMKKVSAFVMLFGIFFYSMPVYALSKDETVYAKLNNDGSTNSIIVNDHLINNNSYESIDDVSDLKNILNINGSEVVIQKDNSLTWPSNGNDIIYQGTSNKEIPVSTSIKYYLDGKEEKLNDIIGKSGKVTISLNYSNHDGHYIRVGTNDVYMYTPFVVTTGMIIDSKNNSNVVISNGKAINNGNKIIVVGISAPGLYESLGIASLKNMNNISITFDTTKFELSSIYSVITPRLLDSSDLEVFDKLDSLYSNIDILQDSMNQIEDGSKRLQAGSHELKNGLAKSMDELSIDSGNVLNEEQLNEVGNTAVEKVKEAFTDEYKNEIAEKAWCAVVDSGAISQEDEEAKAIVTDIVTNAMMDYLKEIGQYDNYINCDNGNGKLLACLAILPHKKSIEATRDALIASNSDSAGKIAMYVAENVTKNVSVSAAYEAAITTANEVSRETANTVANLVKTEAINTIRESLNILYNGVEQLDDGVNILTDGISKFNSEGINKISSYAGEVENIQGKIEALITLGENYQTFTMKNSNTTGQVKFVLVVDSVKVVSEKNIKKEDSKKDSFWTKLLNLFK